MVPFSRYKALKFWYQFLGCTPYENQIYVELLSTVLIRIRAYRCHSQNDLSGSIRDITRSSQIVKIQNFQPLSICRSTVAHPMKLKYTQNYCLQYYQKSVPTDFTRKMIYQGQSGTLLSPVIVKIQNFQHLSICRSTVAHLMKVKYMQNYSLQY